MNNTYQIREKSYTEALASARVGGNLANSIVKTMPNKISQFTTVTDNNVEEITEQKPQTFDLAYFQELASIQESRNLSYIEEKIKRHYGNGYAKTKR